jgi:hypothetical protein
MGWGRDPLILLAVTLLLSLVAAGPASGPDDSAALRVESPQGEIPNGQNRCLGSMPGVGA